MAIKKKIQSTRDFWKYVDHKDFLEVLIFYVTSRCNAKCPGCFFLDNLNKADDLALDEIERFVPTLGRVPNVLFSGGEPFMRKELPEIVQIFARETRPESISFPTNGLLTERIVSVMSQVCEAYPDISMNVNPSLDGIGEAHDRIRGVTGGFEQTLVTLKKVVALKKTYPNLMVSVNTAIFEQSLADLKALFKLVLDYGADAHFTEVDRGLSDEKPDKAKLDYIRDVHRLCIENGEHYLEKFSQAHNLGFFRRIWYHKTAYMYELQEKVLSGEKLPFTCLAGRNLAVIDPEGSVRLCEPLPPVMNLRDADYDFQKIWQSEAFQEGRRKIAEERCSCTHCVFLDYSIVHDRKAMLLGLPRQYMKSKKKPEGDDSK